ncbi:MAG TPA: TetR/AcrR family transcriptional regulator [Candidatus Limnocylindria bacterium]
MTAAKASAGKLAGDTRPARRGGACDAAIRDAALELLVEVGYDRMTIDALAARAHASKATIYRRWPGKREVVVDAINCRAEHAPEPPDTGSLRGDIAATLRAMAEGIGGQDADLMAGVLRAMRSSPELADSMREQVIEAKRQIGRTLVARAVARGELPSGADPGVFKDTAPALMFFRVLVTGQPVDDDFIDHITDDVLVPLLVRSGQPNPGQEI